jgi:glutamate carboxypeptidase
MDPRADPASLLPLARGRYAGFLATLESTVNVDSGSLDLDGVNRVATLCAERLERGGWSVKRLASAPVRRPGSAALALGDVVLGRRTGARPTDLGGRRLLLMAHMDTVFDAGAAAERPFRTEGEHAYGAGVIDDKGGLAAGIEAVELLVDDAGFEDFAEIILMCNPDEEIGSPASRPVIERLAAEADVALGLEAGRRNGDLVTARKGMADLLIQITGRAAHAGVAPDRGVNAALEAAHKTVALQALNGRWPGVTCNVGILRAGTRSNVVAASALLEVDLRAVTVSAFDEAFAEVEAIAARSFVDGTTATCHKVHVHTPMERSDANAHLAAEVAEVGRALGLHVGEQATGGCGDANISTAAGVTTIDGLGPIGGDAHTPSEWLDLGSVTPRIALLAGVLARFGQRG